MARVNRNVENKIYFNIVSGKFAQRVKEGTAGAVTRFSEKKKENVYEILNDRLTGTIESMSIDKTEYGKQLVIMMTDEGESYQVTIPVESKYFDSFCSKILSADLSKFLELAPFSFAPDGKKITGMNIYQDGKKLDYYFTKENPKGKPFAEDKLDESDWKIFKLQERKFFCEMIDGMKNNVEPEANKEETPF